jgi:stage IV sporulation protein B
VGNGANPYAYIIKSEGFGTENSGDNALLANAYADAAERFYYANSSEVLALGEAKADAIYRPISGATALNFTRTASDNIKVGSRFWELLFGKEESKTLIASGDVFGIKMKDKYPAIVDAPGVPALKCGDRITAINGREVHSAAEVKELIGQSGGESVSLTATRGETTLRLEMVPKLEGGEYRLGITLKDVTAGIGTITFIDPETGDFGGLGHGICDSESGMVIPMESGSAMEVVLGGIHKGEVGNPGELSGIMTDTAIGKIATNTSVGVFGRLDNFNAEAAAKSYEIARRSEVKAGEATIISTVKNGKKAEYKIEIYEIDQGSDGSKSFRIRVKDPVLVAITGGIVRGMSGSPIIQNGKLIGAVTHVLVADPTEGYGIFIENMLNAAQMPMAKAS